VARSWIDAVHHRRSAAVIFSHSQSLEKFMALNASLKRVVVRIDAVSDIV
jgi:hypothetical protein